MARDRLSSLRSGDQSRNRYILLRSPKDGHSDNEEFYVSESWSYPSHTRDREAVEPNRPPVAYIQLERQRTSPYFEFEDSEPPDTPPANRWSYPLQITKINQKEPQVPPYPFIGYGQHDSPSRKSDATLVHKSSQGDITSFYREVAVIQDGLKTFNDNIARISDLHARSLNSMDWATARRSVHQVESLTRETGKLGDHIKLRIKDLYSVHEDGRNGQIRKQQAALVKHKFVEAIQNYQRIQQAYRAKYKQRLEKQYMIVSPDATPEEVRDIVEGDHNGQIFSNILQSSSRYGESRAALREVKDRHDDIKKIERSLTELSELFNEMDILVLKGGETLEEVHAMGEDVERSAEQGLAHATKAVDAARAYRKKQWICLGICLALIVCFIVAVTIMAVVISSGNN